jgi:hypothetical protein
VNSSSGQPAYVADTLRLLVARRELIEHTVLDAWRTAKREKRDDANDIAEGAGIVLAALAKVASDDVRSLVGFLVEKSRPSR